MKKTRLLSLFTAFALVLALGIFLPEGALKAEALSGNGTEASPYVVSNFSELREACALAKFGTHLYIEFENKTVDEKLPFDATTLSSAITLQNGYVHIKLKGSYTFRVNHITDSLYGQLFDVKYGATLYVSGDGKLSFSPMLTGASNSVIKVNGGNVIIESGHLDSHPLNWTVAGSAIAYERGNFTVNDGVFTGYSYEGTPTSTEAVYSSA